MSTHANMARMTVTSVASSGTGTITLNAASSGYRSFASAYGADATVDVLITEGTTWEVARNCAYTNSGTTLGRGTLESSSTGVAVAFTSAAVVSVVATAAWGNNLENLALRATIEGFAPTWVSATQVGAGVGSALIESTGLICRATSAPSNITPSVSANTWYHVYLYLSGSTPTLESSTSAPVAFATPAGTARSKTADTSRRYLYSFRTDGSSNIRRWSYIPAGSIYMWAAQQVNATPFRVLSNGTATTSTAVSCAAVASTTSRAVFCSVIDVGASGHGTYVGDNSFTVSSTSFMVGIGNGQVQTGMVPIDASQNLNYIASDAVGGSYIDVQGFVLER